MSHGRSRRSADTRTLVVWCPDWPVVAVGSDGDAGAERPVAVVVMDRVEACSAAARAGGVRRGQRLRDAQRRCPDLVVRPRDPAAEARAFDAVAVAVEALCPRIEILRPGLAALPCRGPARYFGGEESLVARVRAAVADTGHSCGVGVADGVFAAALAARTGEDGRWGTVVPPGESAAFLAPHPVSVLAAADLVGPELEELLVRLGLPTVGAFAALPAGAVADRFGLAGVRAHRMARGLRPRPPAPGPPRRDLAVALEFDPPADSSEPIVFAAKALADELHAGLAAEGLVCVRVEVRTEWSDGRSRVRLWRHDGLLSSLAVAERVRWQLDAPPPPPGGGQATGGAAVGGGRPAEVEAAEGAGGIVLLRIAPDQVVVDEGRQLGLWGETAVDERVARAASRIQAMLGPDAVCRGTLAGGRSPTERVVLVPWGDVREARLPGDAPWPGRLPRPSPAVVPPDPPRAVVTDAAGAPVTVGGRCDVSAPPAALTVDGGPATAVTAWTGPWPAVEWWWDPEHARRLARFQLVTGDGRAWLLAVENGTWRVEGRYD